MRDDSERLPDILEPIHQVERYLEKGRPEFDANELVQVWLLHHLQVIGEASRGLSRGLRSAHPEVPWPDIIGFRHLAVHEYFGIDLQEVWDTAVNDLPPLKKQVEEILRSLGGSDAAAEPRRSGISAESAGTLPWEGTGRAGPDNTGARGQRRRPSSTADNMRKAIEVVVRASERFHRRGLFKQGVLNRLNGWIGCLPCDDRGFVNALVQKAAAKDTGTGADINGVALDQEGEPSLESLVLHYAEQDLDPFEEVRDLLEQIRAKLTAHRGPKYLGPWP